MNDKVFRDREILATAQQKGPASTLGAYFRLSGPGWLQSAITLGGGSLGGALYLGVIGGSTMLWLQMVAIIIGVIMLSAISYVTLSTGKRPYAAINEYVNPVLGASWITATILANMIFILPQFSLCFDVLDKNFGAVGWIEGMIGGGNAEITTKIIISAIITILASVIVCMSFKPGTAAKIFDALLKLIVGAIVICFVLAVVMLTQQGQINWAEAMMGFIPDFSQWNNPSPNLSANIESLTGVSKDFWKSQLVERQQAVMISTTATAVGINMTFLLPYSMLARGWDKTFRGLARWDLITGMAIPFIVVTSCIVLASANAFHAKIDDNFKSSDPTVVQESRLFNNTKSTIQKRMLQGDDTVFASVDAMPTATPADQAAQTLASDSLIASFIAGMSEEERVLASSLVKPNTEQLAKTLVPALGNKSNLVFGLGVLGMGFSTIVILMLINGYAVAEIFNQYDNTGFRVFGALAAGACGFAWFWIWTGDSKTYLVIVASSFAAILLPIAYFTFMALMNNRKLLGAEKPTGVRMSIWNILMTIGVVGALVQSYLAISGKIEGAQGPYVLGGVVTFLILAVVGFSARPRTESN
ncbi:MAG: Mn2+/Fe2+ NRAMP family transporter [Mariniblastus sp.]|jgi:Mn2+/Fe2+ NRAMP family transporter